MKYLCTLLLLAALLLGISGLVFASDITDAQYYGTITITNNSTATTDVSVPCTLSSADLITQGWSDSDFEFVAVRNSSGADVVFGPSVNASYPWCFWVPIIGDYNSLNYILYTGNASLSSTKYWFPGVNGMTVTDNASLEPSDNFIIGISGYIDTTAVGEDIIEKLNAIYIYIGGTGNVTVSAGTANTSLSIRVDSSTDDCVKYYDGGAWQFSLNNPAFAGGYTSAIVSRDGDGAVFHNVTIPQGSTILSASGTITASQNRSNNDANTRITGQDADTAATFSNVADFDGRIRTTANVTWDNISAWVVDETYDTPDISTIIQEIVDRPGWASGNSIAIFWEDFEDRSTHVNDTDRYGYSYDDTPAKAPLLNIVYKNTGDASVAGVPPGEHDMVVTANTTHIRIDVDSGAYTSSAVLASGISDTSDDWIFCRSAAMPYVSSVNMTIGGNLIANWNPIWEYAETFTDSVNSIVATPTFRTASSDADVSAILADFVPISTARAPTYAIGTAPDFIGSTPTISGSFSTIPTPSNFPGEAVITDIAAASGTPVQLPWSLIVGFTIIIASLLMSWLMRNYGTKSVLIKMLMVGVFMGIFTALGILDFWMVVMFLIIAVATGFASRQISLGDTMGSNIIGFLAMAFIGMTLINRILEGAFIANTDISFLNNLMFTQTFRLFGLFPVPIINFSFFTEGLPKLVQWDYSFFGGNAAIIQYFLYSITAVLSIMLFSMTIGLLSNYLNRLR